MENGQGGKKGGKEGGKAPQPSGAAVCSLSGHVHTQVNTRHQAQCLADRRLPDSGENPLLGPDTARPHPGPALEATLGMRGDREGREGGREGEREREREREHTHASAGEGEKERAIFERWKFLL